MVHLSGFFPARKAAMSQSGLRQRPDEVISGFSGWTFVTVANAHAVFVPSMPTNAARLNSNASGSASTLMRASACQRIQRTQRPSSSPQNRHVLSRRGGEGLKLS